MESECDTTGVITKITDDFSVVTVTINDVPRSFSFSKYLLYVFGFQCEGQMTNILDEGMEVNVRYKLPNENVPSIVAVWISEKPEHLCKDAALKPFYEQKGKVTEISEDNLLVRLDSSDLTVVISKEVIFRNGYRTGSALVEGEAVTIDAIPFESEHPTGASYQATCAWVGPAPVLVERFGLSILALDDPWDVKDPMEVVHGTVTVIPNDVVGFAEVGCFTHNGKVLLFRSSFRRGSINIKDHINIGDSLCMRIRYEYLLGGSKQFYAAQAWKDGCEGNSNVMPLIEKSRNLIEGAVDNPSAGTKALEAEREPVLFIGGQNDEVCSFSYENARKRRTRRKQKNKIENQSAEETVLDLMACERDEGKSTPRTETSKSESDEKHGVLINDPPLSGVISIISQDKAYILYDGLMIFVDRKTMFKDGKPLTDDREYVMLVASGDQPVFFEALERNAKDGFTHEATCVWVGKKPSLVLTRTGNSPEHRFEDNLNRFLRTKTEEVPVAVKIGEAGDVLIGEPPLSGPITLTSRNTAFIMYQGYKIFVRWTNMYINGKACDEKEFVLAVTTGFSDVNFEAVKLSPQRYKDLVTKGWIGFTHEATCAWVGSKPSSMDSSITHRRSSEPTKLKHKESAQATYKNTEGKFTAASPVLYCEDPPLEGILKHDTLAPEEKYMSFDSVCISFGGLKVFLDCNLMYFKGKPCSNETILDFISRDIPRVNFEAVKSRDYRKLSYGYSHEATCVWVGQRPGLIMISKTLPPMRFNLLKEDQDRTYRGVVRRFCLPKVAFVYDSEHDTTASLHVSAFGRKPKQFLDFASGKDCISGFVTLNDIVEFKLTCVPTFACVLSATNVKIVSKYEPIVSLLTCSYPEKSTPIIKRETPPRASNVGKVTKVGMTDGVWNPYPLFETSSVRKEAFVETKLNLEAKEDMPSQQAMGSLPTGVMGGLDNSSSDKESTAFKESKQETGNVGGTTLRTEASLPFSREAIPIGVDALSEENKNTCNFGKVSAERKEIPTSGFISKSPSLPGYTSLFSGTSRNFEIPREDAKEGTEQARVNPSQSQKRSPDTSKCSVM